MKVLITKEGRKFYSRKGDLHTQYGYVKEKELKKKKVKTNKGKEMYVIEAGFTDKLEKMKRGPQIITPKDAGIIIAETGIGKESKVLEAGGGSGGLTCFLGNICKEVITYEIRKEFIEIIKKNLELMNLKNVTIKNKDITKGITDKNLDLIVLDMPEPAKAMKHAKKALKQGAFLVCYVPSITQVIDVVKGIEKEGFMKIRVLENIQRDWKIEEQIARPEFRMLGHTGFIIIARKIK